MQIFSLKAFFESFPVLLPFLPFTVGVLGCSLIFSLSFGLFFAWCKLRRNRVVRGTAPGWKSIHFKEVEE